LRYLIPILLILSILISSCDISDPQISAEQEIRDLIYDLTQAFNWGDINAIMAPVHPSFRHKGMYGMQLRQLWLDRMARFPLLEITVSSVEVNGNYAVAHFSMLFTSSTESTSPPNRRTTEIYPISSTMPANGRSMGIRDGSSSSASRSAIQLTIEIQRFSLLTTELRRKQRRDTEGVVLGGRYL